MADYDVIIVGANTPALVTAAYLGKLAGKKTLVLERSAHVGASAMTVEIIPGFKFHPAGTGEYYVHPQVLADLGLEQYGVTRIPARPKLTTVFPDRTHVSLYEDIDATAAEIARISEKDATAYRALFEKWMKIGTFYDLAVPNPPMSWAKFASALSASPELEELLRDMVFGTVRGILDRTFESEKVKAAFLPLSEGLITGPSSASFMYAVGRFIIPWGFARGGLASVGNALRSVAEHSGATIRTSAEVTRILVKRGAAYGVRLADGEEITATTIVTELEPAKTFFELVGREHLETDFIRKINEIPYKCPGVTLNLALRELPDFGFAEDKFNGFIGYYPSYEWGEEAFCDYWAGEIPRNLSGIGYVPSYFDEPGYFAPKGQHVLTQYVFPVPYDLKHGDWTTRKDELFEKWIDALALHAPNIKRAVIGYGGFTPLELEQRFGMTKGDHQHGPIGWMHDLSFRPMVGWSRYRSPISNLYMGGQSGFPVSGVGGIGGHNVAKAILADAEATQAAISTPRGGMRSAIAPGDGGENGGVDVVTSQGDSLMTVKRIERDGDRLAVEGAFMGAWGATMYVGPEGVRRMIRMVLRLPMLAYVASLPFILRRARQRKL